MQRARLATLRVVASVVIASSAAMSAWARPVQGLDAGLDAVLLEARRLYGATEYEQAAAALNRAISMIDARALQDPVPRQQLVDAYELRARARFGLNDQEG